MTDLERLEQIAGLLSTIDFQPSRQHPEVMLSWAERVVALLLANGERVEVCETHGHFPVAGSANCLFKEWGDGVGTPERCRIVSKLLVDYPTEEE